MRAVLQTALGRLQLVHYAFGCISPEATSSNDNFLIPITDRYAI